jgi:hypothetical protein
VLHPALRRVCSTSPLLLGRLYHEFVRHLATGRQGAISFGRVRSVRTQSKGIAPALKKRGRKCRI